MSNTHETDEFTPDELLTITDALDVLADQYDEDGMPEAAEKARNVKQKIVNTVPPELWP